MDEIMQNRELTLPQCPWTARGGRRMASAPQERGRDPYDGLRPWSAITHGVGALLGVVGTVLLLARTLLTGGDPWKLAAFAVYGFGMIALYTASTLYHCLNGPVKLRVALRKLDHSSICLLIAGSYTPICLTALRGPWGWALLGVIWVLTIAGILQSILWINAPRWVTSGIYLFMGWLAVIALYPLWLSLGPKGMVWLVAGGLLYTVGGVLYALKWPGRDNPRFGCHEIFHVFILLGSIAHFMMMWQVILPL